MQIRFQNILVAALALVLALAPVADAQKRGPKRGRPQANVPTAESLQTGVWVSIEGRTSRGTILADEVTILPGPDDKVKLEAVVETVDREAMTLTFLGRTIAVSDETVVKNDVDDELVDFAAVRVGSGAKAKGILDEDGVLHATKIKIFDVIPEKSSDVGLEGPIEESETAKGTFVVLGLKVTLHDRTEIALDN